MKLSQLHDLNHCCTIKEEHPGKIGKMVDDSKLYKIIVPILRLGFYSVKQFFFGSKKYDVPNSIETVFIVCTLNQLRALEGLIKSTPDSMVISIFPVDCKHNLITDVTGNFLHSLKHLPKLFFSLLREKGFRRKAMIYHFDEFLNTAGVYNHAERYLNAIKPKALMMANDHIFFTRSYFRAAQKLRIKTIYTQHASVSAYFPELEFDYAFLDGKEALDKYTADGRKYSSVVFFGGSPRFDKIKMMEKNNIFDLGIAINILDDQKNIINLIESLPIDRIKISVRPHPALQNKLFWEEYCREYSIGYSNPLHETPIAFISNCKKFIAGDSAFHLEVALSGKISYFFNFQNEPTTDWYKYIKNGLIGVKTVEEIINLLIKDLPADVSKDTVKYYVANFDTEYWGNALELFQVTIKEINSGKNFSQWKIKEGESKIFEIKA